MINLLGLIWCWQSSSFSKSFGLLGWGESKNQSSRIVIVLQNNGYRLQQSENNSALEKKRIESREDTMLLCLRTTLEVICTSHHTTLHHCKQQRHEKKSVLQNSSSHYWLLLQNCRYFICSRLWMHLLACVRIQTEQASYYVLQLQAVTAIYALESPHPIPKAQPVELEEWVIPDLDKEQKALCASVAPQATEVCVAAHL